jgi:hypothetical protein
LLLRLALVDSGRIARLLVDTSYDSAWLLNYKHLNRRHDGSAGVNQSLLTIACIFVITNRLAGL